MAFERGPITKEIAAANATIASQDDVVLKFDGMKSNFVAFSSSQSKAIDSVSASSLAVASSISSVSASSADINGNVSSQQQVLAQVKANLTLFSQQLPQSLPATVISVLQGDITAAQSNLTTYNSALTEVGLQAGSFPQTTISGLGSYSGKFQTDSASAQTASKAYISSYTALRTELGVIVKQFPLLQVLAQWQITLNGLGFKVILWDITVDESLISMTDALSTLRAKIDTMSSAIATASGAIQISGAFVQNASAIYSSETVYLNATGLASLSQAKTSRQMTVTQTSNFTASSRGLLQVQIKQFGSSATTVGNQGSNLKTQASSSVKAMAAALAYLKSDAQIRTREVVSAKLLITQALQLFGKQEVAQGVSLLVQATANLQSASQVSM
jgi:hypothetical protein